MAGQLGSRSPEDYRIACICPMAKEFAAMRGMFDVDHADLPMPKSMNAYAFGEIGLHNIVIAIMPNIGNTRAAAIANQLLNDFPIIELALLVGIGGGIPSEKVDVRLGDVVVGKKTSIFGAVVQYDLVKLARGWDIKPASVLGVASTYYMGRVELLDAKHRNEGSDITQHISQMLKKYPKMRKQHYGRPEGIGDLFFPTDVVHTGGATCEGCDLSQVVKRPERPDAEPEIHYGTIASGAFVLKDAVLRDRLAKELGACCIEMEAAGVSQDLNCIVVRGISDYADNHKHDGWQQYAAATAAAYAKELLLSIPAMKATTRPGNQAGRLHPSHAGLNNLSIDSLTLSSSPADSDSDSDDSRDDIPPTTAQRFIGRGEELATMWELLKKQPSPGQHKVLTLHGRSGAGKTRLVAEYARLHASDYSSIFWLNASTEHDLQASLQTICQRVLTGVSHQDYRVDRRTMFAQFDSWLWGRHNNRWLMVYENYDDTSIFDIERYYPTRSHGCIIITSQAPKLKQRNQLDVSEFKVRNDALTLLEFTSERGDLRRDPLASELRDILHGFPIAVTIVGAFLKNSNFTCGQYLQALSNRRSDLNPDYVLAAGYTKDVLYPACNLSLRLIEQSNPVATKLLRLLAYFDNNDIWFDLIAAGRYADNRNKPSWYIELANHWVQFERAMRILSDFQLIRMHSENGSYSMNTCVHDWVLSLPAEGDDATFFQVAFECVANAERTCSKEASGREYQSRIFRHAVRLSDVRFSAYLTHQDCYYMSNVAFVLGISYNFEAAIRLYDMALSRFSDDSVSKANVSLLTMSNLAIQYDSTERSDEAAWLLKKALVTYESLRKSDTVDMIRVMHCLAWTELKQGDLAGAQTTCERADRCCEKYLPPHHELRLAISLNARCLTYGKRTVKKSERSFIPAKVWQSTLRGALHSTTTGVLSAICEMCDEEDQLARIAVMVEDMIAQSVRGAQLSSNETVLARNVLHVAAKTLLDLCRRVSETQKEKGTFLVYLMRLVHVIELTESSDSDAWSVLVQALFLHNDIVHARIARDFYLLYEYGTNDSFMDCNRCECKSLSYKTGRFVCTKCPDVDLCWPCAKQYQEGYEILDTCQHHQLIDRTKNLTAKMAEVRPGVKVEEKPIAWLRSLRKEYLARLDALDSDKKRLPRVILPDVEIIPGTKGESGK